MSTEMAPYLLLLLALCQFCFSSELDEPFIELNRYTLNNGFHRELVTSFTLLSQGELRSYVGCEVLLIENFPSAIYVDPYEIARNEQLGGIKALFTGNVDVEKHTESSVPFTFYVFTELQSDDNSVGNNHSLPMHLRYHKSRQSEEYVTVTLNNPEVLIRCDNTDDTLPPAWSIKEFACYNTNHIICKWTIIPSEYVKESEPLEFTVPIGREEHHIFVIIITFITTITGTILLIPVIVLSKNK